MILPGHYLNVCRNYAVILLSFATMRHVGEWRKRDRKRVRGFPWLSVAIRQRSRKTLLADSTYCWTVDSLYDDAHMI